jgi:hypothetical protein
MWQERKPDAVGEVKVDSHTVKTYSFGEGDNVLSCSTADREFRATTFAGPTQR